MRSRRPARRTARSSTASAPRLSPYAPVARPTDNAWRRAATTARSVTATTLPDRLWHVTVPPIAEWIYFIHPLRENIAPTMRYGSSQTTVVIPVPSACLRAEPVGQAGLPLKMASVRGAPS